MSLFGSIMGKIFGTHAATPASAQPSGAAPTGTAPSGAAAPTTPGAPTQSAPVDVEAVLTDMAAKKGGGGNWQTSIVDLLKLLDLDSSLSARKELAGELGVHAGEDGSAEQNMALSRAVMQKLAENGGKVPDSLKG